MVEPTLIDIREHVEAPATLDGQYYVICGRTGGQPVPVAGLSGATARTADQYRPALATVATPDETGPECPQTRHRPVRRVRPMGEGPRRRRANAWVSPGSFGPDTERTSTEAESTDQAGGSAEKTTGGSETR